MPPAARLSLPYAHKNRQPSIAIAPARFRVQGWDPVLIVSQIVSLQALHYLTLSLIVPLLVSAFANQARLAEEGGASSVSIVMDWREFTGRSTASLAARRTLPPGLVGLATLTTGKAPGGTGPDGDITSSDVLRGLVRVIEPDAARGWAVAFGWSFGAMIDIIWLYHLVRRPTHILDFALTLVFNHLILTTYYSGSFPTSMFFWLVVVLSSVAQIVTAEQLCVRRELRDGFSVDATNTPIPATPDLRRTPFLSSRGAAGVAGSSASSPAVPRTEQRKREEIELAKLKGPASAMPVRSLTPVPTTSSSFGSTGPGQYERLATDDR